MPRKGENIYHRKDGRWEGRLVVGKTATGKTAYRYFYGHSYAEVKRRLAKALILQEEDTGRRAAVWQYMQTAPPPNGLPTGWRRKSGPLSNSQPMASTADKSSSTFFQWLESFLCAK